MALENVEALARNEIENYYDFHLVSYDSGCKICEREGNGVMFMTKFPAKMQKVPLRNNDILFMKHVSIFIIALLTLISCRNKDNSNIRNSDIETISVFEHYSDKKFFSSFVDTIELIPLETTADNLIGEITRIIFHDKKYYIRSTNGMQNAKLFVFDETGRFIRRIGKKGNGPGEYGDLYDFAITNDNHIVLADYHRLLHFDSEGRFLNSIKMNFSAAEIVSSQDNEIIAYLILPTLFENRLLSKIDKEGNQELFFNRGETAAIKCNLVRTWRSLMSTGSYHYFNYPFSDTIFSISQDLKKISPLYYIDYGEKKLSNIEVAPDEDVLTWEKKLKRLDDYWDTASMGVGENFTYLGMIDKAFKGYLTLYSHRTKKSFSARKLVDDMYLQGNVIPITAKRIPHNMDGDDIIWEIDPKILLKGHKQYMRNLSEPKREEFRQKYPEWERICTSLKEEDNPVLLRIKIKQF